jgi:hypothetical protein
VIHITTAAKIQATGTAFEMRVPVEYNIDSQRSLHALAKLVNGHVWGMSADHPGAAKEHLQNIIAKETEEDLELWIQDLRRRNFENQILHKTLKVAVKLSRKEASLVSDEKSTR